jgi:hypothetical protein
MSDKYRIPSARLKNWNYGRNAAYFITICTQNRISLFGEIMIRTDAMQCISTIKKTIQPNQPKNLASIIRGFKIGVTKIARLIHADFAWQSQNHDRIIRSNGEYKRFSTHIKNNPANWRDDEFFD